jgi:hypothetical protein
MKGVLYSSSGHQIALICTLPYFLDDCTSVDNGNSEKRPFSEYLLKDSLDHSGTSKIELRGIKNL